MTALFTCPVCGYPCLDEEPESVEGGGSSYEICPSCGFQFGVTDDARGETYSSWRAKWVAKGMPWDSEGIYPRPERWNPAAQLALLLDSGGQAD